MPEPLSKNSVLNNYLINLQAQFPDETPTSICKLYQKKMHPRTIETSSFDDLEKTYQTVLAEFKKKYGQ